uniref:Regulator of microtubule dynamics protein 1 n=1 Tax=Macrostomum lignano TaxID=282301 RepID=A0A1I8FKC8_9PLAT
MGILLDLTGRFEGTKKRIENSFLVKEHFTKALDKKPDDAVVLHCLGVWCYTRWPICPGCSGTWLPHSLLSAHFNLRGGSSICCALRKSEFYASNLNYIGKAYYQLKKLPEAKEFFQKTINTRLTDTMIESGQPDEEVLIEPNGVLVFPLTVI